MKIDKQTNSSYKILMELFGNDEAVCKMLEIGDYRRKHTLKDKDYIVFDFDVLDVLKDSDVKNAIRKPRELSAETRKKNFDKAYAKLLKRYQIEG